VTTRLAFWLVVELLLAAAVSSASSIHRREEARAWIAWHDSPTPETRAEVHRQRTITLWHQVAFAGILFAGMAAVTVPVVLAVARRRGSRLGGPTQESA
jgi:hypothetical protein